jgi:hypothetical protein
MMRLWSEYQYTESLGKNALEGIPKPWVAASSPAMRTLECSSQLILARNPIKLRIAPFPFGFRVGVIRLSFDFFSLLFFRGEITKPPAGLLE